MILSPKNLTALAGIFEVSKDDMQQVLTSHSSRLNSTRRKYLARGLKRMIRENPQ